MWAEVLERNYTVVQDGEEAPDWIVYPSSPVFDGMTDPRLRALVAVGLGCDTWPGGVPNLGPAKMMKLLQRLPEIDRVQRLVEALVAWPKSPVRDPRVLICFADAFMYEKTKLGYYANGSPEKLDKYLIEFANEGTLIVADLEIFECVLVLDWTTATAS